MYGCASAQMMSFFSNRREIDAISSAGWSVKWTQAYVSTAEVTPFRVLR